MNTSKFRFTLDLQKTQSQISIPITRGDTARTWYISFSDGGQPYAIEEGSLAKLEIKRPTGTHIMELCAVENGTTVCYPFSQNEKTAAVEGLHECAVILYGADGEILASPRFTMIVIDRVVSSDDINISDEDQGVIDAMIAAEAARQQAETGRINAESDRQTAETGRKETAAFFQELRKDGRFLPKATEEDEGKYVRLVGGQYVLDNAAEDGIDIEANPDEEATSKLEKLMIGETVYTLSANDAYKMVVSKGYSGTEDEFATKLAELLALRIYDDSVGDTETDFAVYGGDTGLVDTHITFSIGGTEYFARTGMTWSEWIESMDNTGGFVVTDGNVWLGEERAVLYNGNTIAATDNIIDGAEYS